MAETPKAESLDVSVAMESSFRTTGDRVHAVLTIGLLAACAANLMLVCSLL